MLDKEKRKEKIKEISDRYYCANREKLKEKSRKYKEKNKDKFVEQNAKYYINNKEKINNRNFKYQQENKEKIALKSKEYYDENREKILIKSKDYYQKNKEKHKDSVKKWMENNREQYLEYRRNKAKNDRKKRPYYYAWRDLLKGTIKRMNKIKNGRTIDILGYSSLELKHYIENQFKPGMTWENHGEWHIDHIKEIHTFDIDTPQNIVNALCNLQPLWQYENIRKYYSNR